MSTCLLLFAISFQANEELLKKTTCCNELQDQLQTLLGKSANFERVFQCQSEELSQTKQSLQSVEDQRKVALDQIAALEEKICFLHDQLSDLEIRFHSTDSKRLAVTLKFRINLS